MIRFLDFSMTRLAQVTVKIGAANRLRSCTGIATPTVFGTVLSANSNMAAKMVSSRGHDPLIPYGPIILSD